MPTRGNVHPFRVTPAPISVPNARRGRRRVPPPAPPPIATADPVESARAAGLRYVSDAAPGIRRRRAGKSFSYVGPDGAIVRDAAQIQRIKSLVIPPAWTDVWICTHARGHLQATGRDARGRKQYRYHVEWRRVRDTTKYDKMIAFGQALPNIRERTAADLARPGLPREKVLATVVQLLEKTLIRVGNEEYARTNKSFGLTTMRDTHVDVSGATLTFTFRGKGGIDHSVDINDRRLARIVKASRDLPGYELFQYVDEGGARQSIDSGDVNDYLRDIGGLEFTAKDFRTWAGTVLAACALREFEAFDSNTQAKRNIVRAIERVAAKLGNTRAVCRKSYVHPAILDSYLDGTMLETLSRRANRELAKNLGRLEPEEAAVLVLLQQRLAHETGERAAPARKRKIA